MTLSMLITQSPRLFFRVIVPVLTIGVFLVYPMWRWTAAGMQLTAEIAVLFLLRLLTTFCCVMLNWNHYHLNYDDYFLYSVGRRALYAQYASWFIPASVTIQTVIFAILLGSALWYLVPVSAIVAVVGGIIGGMINMIVFIGRYEFVRRQLRRFVDIVRALETR
jgi:hypothetical protein